MFCRLFSFLQHVLLFSELNKAVFFKTFCKSRSMCLVAITGYFINGPLTHKVINFITLQYNGYVHKSV